MRSLFIPNSVFFLPYRFPCIVFIIGWFMDCPGKQAIRIFQTICSHRFFLTTWCFISKKFLFNSTRFAANFWYLFVVLGLSICIVAIIVVLVVILLGVKLGTQQKRMRKLSKIPDLDVLLEEIDIEDDCFSNYRSLKIDEKLFRITSVRNFIHFFSKIQ